MPPLTMTGALTTWQFTPLVSAALAVTGASLRESLAATVAGGTEAPLKRAVTGRGRGAE